MAYAEVPDYEALYGAVGDQGMLEAKLGACSVVIDAELASHGRSAEGVSDALLRLVCCQMVERLMPAAGSDVPTGATYMSETVGPYTHGYSFKEPYGSPRMRDDELRLLLGQGSGARMAWAPIGGGHE
ncbi:MAG: hypothetical protein IJ092_03170 [Atopobiaceae bacterium]|nr:hypothetical protein [Atopobiaceae bacterium]